MAAWSDRYWTSRDGLKLHFRDYAGPSDRPPLLCLHGLTRNGRDFESLANRYAGQWRLIVPDFRGRGSSGYDPNSANYLPQTYAADVIQLLAEIEVDRAVFIGTSLGGLVTMIVAAVAPQLIAGALLNDVGPELNTKGLDRIRDYVGKPELFRDWAEATSAFSERLAGVHPRYDTAAWERYARRVCRQTERGIELDYDMAIVDPFDALYIEPRPDAWPLFAALGGRPLTILRGETSDLLPAEAAERMRQAIPGAELVTVPKVGHAPDFEEPETIAAVDRLLERVLAA
ncbi:alpha/beta hydrolase [Sphingomonas sinipercae]|uniref:Alpha/beta hydrolase n=1 Tax=Sphingomonas sinipercae TaxID=2714944 RepID=A0A6G7ZME8_9SPHN|nr:alpha/beta hydrolase [Sphingomonas sinipercae]QIL02090.1 alpha/beta hydrolase [Sphingomonas sinipercae]